MATSPCSMGFDVDADYGNTTFLRVFLDIIVLTFLVMAAILLASIDPGSDLTWLK